MTIKNLYPTQRPSLDLNFANSKRLDPRITFTRGSIGTYVGEDGLIKTAAANEARFDHDPVTGESLGLLIEEERTNLLTYSEELDTNWSALRLDVLAFGDTGYVSSLSPNGVTYATYWRPTTDTDRHQNTQFPSVSAGNHILSFFIKADPSGYYRFGIFTNNPSPKSSIFNAATGTIESSQHENAEMQPFPNSWYRVSVTLNATAGSFACVPYVLVDDGNIYAPGDGVKGMWVWGAQLEEGSFLTSYIPTPGSGCCRAADVASLTNTNVYDTDSFTILNEPYGAAAGGSTLNIVGGGQTPVKRTTVYNQDLSQTQINSSVGKFDEFWRWRILGSSFALPNFLTDGQVTVDWGDGTVETLTTSEHTFSDGGGYHDVGFRLDSGTYFRPYINDNATHKDKVIALGPAPESMKLSARRGFYGCSALKVFDATVDATSETYYEAAWSNCSSLTSFPLINTTGVTNFGVAWDGCSSLTSFPLIDTSAGTIFSYAWRNCSSLTSFPLIDTSSGTNFSIAWLNCSSLTSFPLIDTSSGTDFARTWEDCTSLTSFPLIDTSSGTDFYRAWHNCSSLTSFPLIDISSGTKFYQTWLDCSSLTTFPANFFDSWTGTPEANCFYQAWANCSSLTATSVENILNSIDTSGQSAPAGGPSININYDSGTGTPSISTAVTNLKSRGWTITLNGVAQ